MPQYHVAVESTDDNRYIAPNHENQIGEEADELLGECGVKKVPTPYPRAVRKVSHRARMPTVFFALLYSVFRLLLDALMIGVTRGRAPT